MRDMLDREEQMSLSVVDQELSRGEVKLRDLTKKFTQNVERMSKAKEGILTLLGKAQSQAFLQVRHPR